MEAFGRYSDYYDLLYADKDYEGEITFIEEVFRTSSSAGVVTVLDGGCGTGGHAIRLARRGYRLTGVDISPAMLKRAADRAQAAGLDIEFRQGDLRSLELSRQFDAAICMFAVIGYVTETADVLKALATIRRHLKPGAPFVFDFWNGLAVLRTLPSERVKIVEAQGSRVVRIAQPEMDACNHVCRVHYRVLVLRDGTLADEVAETHVMRFYFPQEIIQYLRQSGFEVLRLCAFPDLKARVDETRWNAAVIARAV